MKYSVAGVGYGKALDASGNQLFKTVTLTDSGFSTSTSIEENRGGAGHALQSMYVHSGTFEVAMKDCLADLFYVSLQVGSEITSGANIYTTEEVTTTVANQITVVGTPVGFGALGLIGWYAPQGTEEANKITFVGQTASVSNLPIGSKVCVTYLVEDDSARVIEVVSNFVPAEVHLVFTLPLFKAGVDASNASTSSQLGEWIVDVPRFMFDGAVALNTTSSSNVGFDIKGKALASTSVSGCSNKSIYATITEVIYGKDEFANVIELAVADADISVGVAGTNTLKVYKIYNDGTSAKLVDNSKLTFASSVTAKATVGAHTGIVTGVATGESVITAIISSKPSISTVAVVTVTA